MPTPDNETPQLQSVPSILRPGKVVDDRFEIIAHLGSGGMGSVYKARQLEIERYVALKIMHPRFVTEAAAVKRFQREAQIISGLSHTNILSIYSFGGAEGLLYLATEFVDGKSLGEMIARKGRMPPEQAVPLLLQICHAMSYAHKNEVLHRDLKPDNVMVVHSPEETLTAKVVDFGLACLAEGLHGQRLTKTGEVVGDPRYMSPEQCQGLKLDSRTDIYSFGCMMYELLTGKVPFDADNPVAVMHRHLSAEPEPFAKRLGLPPALETITFTAMCKDRGDRYDSFDAIAEVLTKFCECPNVDIDLPARRRVVEARLPRRKLIIAGSAFCILLTAITLYNAGFLDPSLVQARIQYSSAATPADKLRATITLAEIYARRHDYTDAEQLLKEAAILAVAPVDAGTLIRAHSLLGRVYMDTSRESEAVQSFSLALSEVEAMAHKQKASDSVLADCHRTLSGYAQLAPLQAVQAAHSIARALDTSGGSGQAVVVLTAVEADGEKSLQINTAFAIARLQLKLKHWKEAEQYYDRALRLSDDRAGKSRLLETVIAEVRASGNTELTTRFLEKQLKEINPSDLVQVITLKLQIADLHFQSADYSHAKTLYQGALESAKSAGSSQASLIARALDGIGESNLMTGEYAAAENAFNQEVVQLNQIPGAHTVQLAEALFSLGAVICAQGRHAEADQKLNQALQILNTTQTSTDLSMLRSNILLTRERNMLAALDKTAQTALAAKDLRGAEKTFRKKVSLQGNAPPAERAQTLCSLGNVLKLQLRRDEAAQELKKAAQLLEGLPGTGIVAGLKKQIQDEIDNIVVEKFILQGQERNAAGDYTSAERFFRKAVKEAERNPSIAYNCAFALHALGGALHNQRRFDEAESAQSHALTIVRRLNYPQFEKNIQIALQTIRLARKQDGKQYTKGQLSPADN